MGLSTLFLRFEEYSARTGNNNNKKSDWSCVVNQQDRKERPNVREKAVQYLMLLLLLVLMFIVSAYAGKAYLNWKNRNAGAGFGSAGAEKDGTQDGKGSGGTDTNGGGSNRAGGSDQTGKENQDGENDRAESKKNAAREPGETESGGKGTIVLDAGHGGFDPGVSGASGVSERELNLVLAKKLEALLTEEGYRVVQTRPTEEGLYDEEQAHKKAQDMQRRCAVIEAAQPLLTVSIHQNSYPDSSVSGPQVFYYTQSKEGERLAACIQNCMNEQLAPKAPKSHKGNDSYYILRRSASITVIVECGFLTNPDEEAKLQDEAYQDKTACAIRDGILDYLDVPTNTL